MSEELKPCPFCGYTDIRRHQFGEFKRIPCCTECGVAVIGGDWNRRAQPAPQAVPEGWRKTLQGLVDDIEGVIRESDRLSGLGEILPADQFAFMPYLSLARDLLAAAPTPPAVEVRRDLLDWAVTSWHEQVAQRPLVNVYRRTLDSVWRQVITFAGGDAESLIGPRHDDLLDERGEVPKLPPFPAQEVRS